MAIILILFAVQHAMLHVLLFCPSNVQTDWLGFRLPISEPEHNKTHGD